MKAVVVGCGRVGAGVADELDRAGWQVLIIDLKSAAFDRLPASFTGTALRGDGTDEDVLRRAGAENADLFLALTEGDNRNIMAAQLGIEALSARKTVAKVNDPVRAEAYAHLGIATLCRTNLMASQILGYAGQAVPARPGIYVPETPHQHEAPVGEDPSAAGPAPGTGTPGSPGSPGGVAVPGPTGPGGSPSAEA
jgi:trk system potassium uptake protein TrkA